MAERDHIGIDTFGGVTYGRSFLQDRCGCRSNGPVGGDNRMGDNNHLGSIFDRGFGFIDGKGITR